MPYKIVVIGDFGYFEGRKYFHKDIDLIADMRRKGVSDGTLFGAALEDFVVQCLRTPGYQVLGMPLTPADQAYLAQVTQARTAAARERALSVPA